MIKNSRGRGPGEFKKCPVCGADYFALDNKTKIGRAKFCSPKCAWKGRPRPEWTGDKNPAWKGGLGKTERRKRYEAKHPEKTAAHRLVSAAKEQGILVPKPCEVCGTTIDINAHHHDYSKPLDITQINATRRR